MAGRYDCGVLVAGGGIAGTALAVALAQQGLQVQLVEPRPPPAWETVTEATNTPDVGLRVSALGLGSRHFLGALDAWPVADRRGPTAYQQMQVEAADGGNQLSFEAHQHGLPALGWIVDNWQLQQTLWRAARAAGVVLRAGVQVNQIKPRARAVTVQLDAGDEVRCALLVAADGARSPLRQQLAVETYERDYQQAALVAVVNSVESNRGLAWQRFLPDGPLAFLPVSDGRSSIVWSMSKARADEYLALDAEQFCAALSVASDTRFGSVLGCGERAAFPLSMMLARRYVEQRVVFLGDAAHRIHPLAGQGLNIGLQDAAALAEIIAADDGIAEEPAALQRQLRRYERWRRSDNEVMVRGVDTIGRVLRGEGWLARMGGAGFSLVDRSWPLKDLFLRWACGLAEQAPAAFRHASGRAL